MDQMISGKHISSVLALALFGLAAQAQKQEPKLNPAPMGFISVAPGQTHFVQAPHRTRFVPWGVNYDRDYKMRLLEEYWQTEWKTVEEDFGEIKAMGANVVRVHLQLDRFMRSETESDPTALRQLRRLVALAEQKQLYLDLTGLACYRKSAVPAWYDNLSEKARWEVQARFWEAVAKTCAGSPAVFCYNLMNEPILQDTPRPPGDWLCPPFMGFCYVQYITLDLAGRSKAEVARAWIQRMSTAIRQHDRRHMITVGFLPFEGSGFTARELKEELDYISIHIYPDSKKLQECRTVLRQFSVGKPVVIEETFPLTCSGSELEDFLRDSKQFASGWVGFYWGKTLAEYKAKPTIQDWATIAWLEIFRKGPP